MFEGIKQIPLKNPHINGVDPGDEHLLQPHMDTLKEILAKLAAGERVYLGITSGERKGSIAFIQSQDADYDYKEREPTIRHTTGSWENKVRISGDSLYIILGWEKRRNKIKWSTYQDGTVYLPDYEGPTLWEKFDKKAAAAKALKEHEVEDSEGNLLAVGDRVIYINARYGSGARLERGVINEIKMKVEVHGENQYVTAHVIINNDEGQRSDIQKPWLSVIKASSPLDLLGATDF